MACKFRYCKRFLSTPSARRATKSVLIGSRGQLISIHALREEGDAAPMKLSGTGPDFYPRPPRGGRPGPAFSDLRYPGISIHALREEGDFTAGPIGNARTYFYPRPPRGGRPFAFYAFLLYLEFLSTPSARRATKAVIRKIPGQAISIHALREEGDQAPADGKDGTEIFLSTPSARRATGGGIA